MNEQVKGYLAKYPCEIVKMYNDLRHLIFDSVSCEPEETLWVKLPSYFWAPHVCGAILNGGCFDSGKRFLFYKIENPSYELLQYISEGPKSKQDV